MNLAFSFSNYIIKSRGLPVGGKYHIYDQQKNLVLCVEYKAKMKMPYHTYHIYSDETKQQELLLIQDHESDNYDNYYEVTDIATGKKIGGIYVDWGTTFSTTTWRILDAGDAEIGLAETTKHSLLHEFTVGFIWKFLNIKVNDRSVAELKCNSFTLGQHMLVDFSMDTNCLLDRRLGLAVALLITPHYQESKDSN